MPPNGGGYPSQQQRPADRNDLGAQQQRRGQSPPRQSRRERQNSPDDRTRSHRRSVRGPPQLHQMHSQEHEVDLTHIIVEQFRKTIIQRGGSSGIHGLGRIFRIMDDDGNRRLTLPELQSGLRDFGLKYDKSSLALLMTALDKSGESSVSFDRFLATVRGPVNKRRRALIDMAFGVMDKSGDGVITIRDVQGVFKAKHHPDVVSGRLKEDEALAHWLSQFEGTQKDGRITRDEFQAYYKNVSASIDDDDYFELMMRNAWHIPGGKGQMENTSNARILVTFANGEQKVVMIEDDLGLDLRDHAAVVSKLKKQGLKNVIRYSTSGRA